MTKAYFPGASHEWVWRLTPVTRDDYGAALNIYLGRFQLRVDIDLTDWLVGYSISPGSWHVFIGPLHAGKTKGVIWSLTRGLHGGRWG